LLSRRWGLRYATFAADVNSIDGHDAQVFGQRSNESHTYARLHNRAGLVDHGHAEVGGLEVLSDLDVAGDRRRCTWSQIAAQPPPIRPLGGIEAGRAKGDAPLTWVGGKLLGEVRLALDVGEPRLGTHRL